MNIAVFVTIWSVGVSSTDLNEYFLGSPLSFLKANGGVNAVEIYTPEPGDVPVMDDVPSPTIIVQFDMEEADAAVALTESAEFLEKFTNKKNLGEGIEEVKLELTEAINYPLPGQETAPPRTAPFSFVVRYYGPVEDGGHFADFYCDNHPPILARFPGIRNVFCYKPLNSSTSGQIDDARLIIGNEVVFDDLAALNNALKSDVIKAAREDSSQFQKFGYNSHHAMHRERVYTRD